MSALRISTLYLSGSVAKVEIRIIGDLNCRQRRALALALYRQAKPMLRYFRSGFLFQRDGSNDFRRLEERGIFLSMAAPADSAAGRLGFEIRMQRLEAGLSLESLAARTGLSRDQISRIERGLCRARADTLARLNSALANVEKVEIAQGKGQSIKPEGG